MKILIDQNISYKIKTINDSTNFDFIHVSDLGLNGRSDLEIWKYSKNNNLAILTFDTDFYNLSLLNHSLPKIILLQIGNSSTKNLIEVLIQRENDIKEFISNPVNEKLYCLKIKNI